MRKTTRTSYAQRQLPFAGAQTRALRPPLRTEKRLFAALLCMLVLCIGAYGSLVGSTVVYTAARQGILRESEKITASNGTLEALYILQTRTITEKSARANGFITSADREFVTRSGTLSYSGNAR